MILQRIIVITSSVLMPIGFIYIAFPPITLFTFCLAFIYGTIHGCISSYLVFNVSNMGH